MKLGFQSRDASRSARTAPMRRAARRAEIEPLEGRVLLAAGNFDPSFDSDGSATVEFRLGVRQNYLNYVGYNEASDVAIQPDGKIVIAGVADQEPDTYFSLYFDFAVARLNADGSPDATFGVDGKASIAFDLIEDGRDYARALAIQPDGKIVLVGQAQASRTDLGESYRGDYDLAVARFLPDGTPDASFGIGGKATFAFTRGGEDFDSATGVAILPDGKIIVVGGARQGPTGYDFVVLRLTPGGYQDIPFGIDGRATIPFDIGGLNDDFAADVAIQDDGKIVVAGTAERATSTDGVMAVARLTHDGRIDPTFGVGGRSLIDFDSGESNHESASAVAIQADGRIVVAGSTSLGSTSDGEFAVARLDRDGWLDPSFGDRGRATIDFTQGVPGLAQARDLAIQDDGRIVLVGAARVGQYAQTKFAVARVDADGSIDSTFQDGGRLSYSIPYRPDLLGASAVALQPDGKIVVVGTVRYGGLFDSIFAISRLEGGYDGPPEPPVVPPEWPPVEPPVEPPVQPPIEPPVEPPVSPPAPPEQTPVEPGFPNIFYPGQGKDWVPPVVTSARAVFVGMGRRRRLAGFALTFSEPIRAHTLSPGDFALGRVRRVRWGRAVTTPARVVGTAYDPTTNTVTLLTRRKARFPRGATVAILPGVADLSGNAPRPSDPIRVR